jgi:UDP-N-acetylmuramate: L-alanyl-gamma-D-glutamyl-meso-diaminopimelate ligase
MGSLAALLQEAGYRVRGSDANVYPPMSTFLTSKAIPILEGYRAENLEPPPDLVVVGNAIRRDNAEAEAVLRGGLSYCSMPQALSRFFLDSRQPVVVTGTHGKTTTAALIVWLLWQAGMDPGCLVGGLMRNFEQSYLLGRGAYFVVEGDEYDTAFFDKGPKFLHYRPRICVLTGVEFDHADVFPDFSALKAVFITLVRGLPADGLLVVNADDPVALEVSAEARCPVRTYGLRKPARLRVEEAAYAPDGTRFSVQGPGPLTGTFTSPLPGAHNVSNALAMLGVACELGLSTPVVQQALATFKGVRRRQEIRGERAGVTIIDDFAHHPTAVRATIEALRPWSAGRRLWAIFEPRTNTSRRRVFQSRYAAAFDSADLVLIKEPPGMDSIARDERLSARQLAEDIAARGVEAHYFPDVDAILAFVVPRARPGDVLLVMSSGPFDRLPDRLLQALPPG